VGCNRDLVWNAGENFAIDQRTRSHDPERLARPVAELVRLPVGLILAERTAIAQAAQV
jgi:hypothetical protein